MNLGTKLNIIRRHKGLSMDSLSKISKVSKTTISEIENNKVNPTLKTLKKLSDAMEEDISLFTDDSSFIEWLDYTSTNILENGDFANKIKEAYEFIENKRKRRSTNIPSAKIFLNTDKVTYDYSALTIKKVSEFEAIKAFQSLLDYIKFNSNNKNLLNIGHDLDEEKPLFNKTIASLELDLLGILYNRGELINKNDILKGDNNGK